MGLERDGEREREEGRGSRAGEGQRMKRYFEVV
jgi:hypothetical protein